MPRPPQYYPPFGWSVFYHRIQRAWVWREKKPKGNPDDVTEGRARSRAEGIAMCRAELRRRGARDQDNAQPGQTRGDGA